MKHAHAPNVAVLINTSTGWGQRLIHGIIQYAHERGPWSLWIEPSTFQPEVHVPQGWQGHGIIARVAKERDAAGDGSIPSLDRHVHSAITCIVGRLLLP